MNGKRTKSNLGNMKIAGFTLDGGDSLTTHIPKTLINWMDHFVDIGVFTSKSEMVRNGLRALIVKLVAEDELFRDYEILKNFNASQDEIVRIDGVEHEIIRRCE